MWYYQKPFIFWPGHCNLVTKSRGCHYTVNLPKRQMVAEEICCVKPVPNPLCYNFWWCCGPANVSVRLYGGLYNGVSMLLFFKGYVLQTDPLECICVHTLQSTHTSIRFPLKLRAIMGCYFFFPLVILFLERKVFKTLSGQSPAAVVSTSRGVSLPGPASVRAAVSICTHNSRWQAEWLPTPQGVITPEPTLWNINGTLLHEEKTHRFLLSVDFSHSKQEGNAKHLFIGLRVITLYWHWN